MQDTARRLLVVAGIAGAVVLLALPGDAPAPPAVERGAAGGTAAAARLEPAAPTGDPATATGDVATAPDPPRVFTLVATGDVLLHGTLVDQARADAAAAGAAGLDFRPLLAGVEPLVSAADLAICHLETPIAPAGGPYAGYPSFSVPPEIAPALADVGYDACSTASNHTYDRGAGGVDRTLDALDGAGIRHAGSARTPSEAEAVTVIEVAGAEVALLSYTYGFNGVPPPDGQAWRSNPIDEARILADAGRARAAGADVVVVALHWGDEYQPEPNTQQRALGPRLVRSADIDLVLGHHAHVVQPVEPVDGEWVVYGMGNLVAHHGTGNPANEEGLLVQFTFAEAPGGWRATRAEYAPLLVAKSPPPIRLLDVAAALSSDGAVAVRRERLEQAWERTTAVVSSLGGPAHGLTPVAAP